MPSRVCYSPSSLKAEIEIVRRKVSIKETGNSWNIIEQGIIQLTECCKSGGCKLTADMVTGIRSLSKSIITAMNSERTRLSRSAVEFITVLSADLGPTFESLVQVFMPTLIGLCAQTSKMFASRAKACILAVVKHTQCPSILPYLAESMYSKSLLLRLAAAEGVLAGVSYSSHPDGTRGRYIENVIELASLDVDEDVKATGKKILQAYKALLPASGIEERVIAPFSVVRAQGAAISQSPEVPYSCRPVVSPVRQGALRAPWHSGPWRGPKSAPKSVNCPSDPKRNPVTTKIRSINPTSAVTVRLSSRTAPPKAERLRTCASTRQPPTRKITGKADQKKLAKGERPVTKGSNPVIKTVRRAMEENILPPQSGAPLKSSVLCTPSRTGTGHIRRSQFKPCRDLCHQKVPLASIRRELPLLPPRPVNRVKTPEPSHLVVHAEKSILDDANIIGCLEEMEDLLLAMQAGLVDGWAAKMEAMGLRSALSEE